MSKFKIGPYLKVDSVVTARVGSAADTAGRYVDADCGKFVKLAADSRYALCADGDPIEGQLIAIEPATQDGFSIGSVAKEGRLSCICDGSEAAGTGSIAVGDYVVCGTVVAAGTAMTSTTGPKVKKATNQPGAIAASTVATADTAAAVKVALDLSIDIINDTQKNLAHAWRVVSLGVAGAVGDTCIIERVIC